MIGVHSPRRLFHGVLLLVCVLASISVYAQESDDRIAAVIAATEPEVIQRFDSPDGSFYAEVTVYPCVAIGEEVASYERLDLTEIASGKTQQIAEQVINCGGLGAYGLWVTRWSANGAYMYYTDSREGTPDGLVTDWAAPLSRVRLDDLQVDRLGPARFSPSGNWLVTWNQTQIGVMTVDVEDRTDFTPIPANLIITNVLWLPDNSGILYLQADQPFMSTRSAVTHIDITTMEQNVLMDNGA